MKHVKDGAIVTGGCWHEYLLHSNVRNNTQLRNRTPRKVLRQYQIESGHGKSRLAIEQYNLFGMSCVSNRPTTQTGCKNGYGVYRSILESVLDYKLWQDKYSGLSRTEYLMILRKVYIKDKKYLREWFK